MWVNLIYICHGCLTPLSVLVEETDVSVEKHRLPANHLETL